MITINRRLAETLLRFRPLRHMQASGLHARVTTPGFSRLGIPPPSGDVASRKPFRPYCMPERPWGFPFKAFPPRRSSTCLQANALMSLREPLPLFSSEVEKRTRGTDRLQSVTPRSDPYKPHGPKDVQHADAFLGLCLPRVLSPLASGTEAPNSHELGRPVSPRRGPRKRRQLAPRSVTNQRIGMTSPEASDPSEVSHLIRDLVGVVRTNPSRMS